MIRNIKHNNFNFFYHLHFYQSYIYICFSTSIPTKPIPIQLDSPFEQNKALQRNRTRGRGMSITWNIYVQSQRKANVRQRTDTSYLRTQIWLQRFFNVWFSCNWHKNWSRENSFETDKQTDTIYFLLVAVVFLFQFLLGVFLLPIFIKPLWHPQFSMLIIGYQQLASQWLHISIFL